MTLIQKLIDLDRSKQLRIAIVGDEVVDEYIHGRLEIGQEDCQKFIEESKVIVSGGAANAERSLAKWNARTLLCSQNAKSFWPIPIKKRFLVNGKTVFRHDVEHILNKKTAEASQQETLRMLGAWEPHAILLSDYDKGFMTPNFIRNIIDLAERFGIPIVVDAKRSPDIYAGTVLKCNEEYATKFRVPFFLAAPGEYVVTHKNEYPVTRTNHHVNLPDVQCVNSVGAGDCFAAHLTLALAHGLHLDNAVTIAHSAGRVYVQHPYNRPPYPHEIRRDINPLDPALGKVLQLGLLPALRQSNPGRIVFTNGVFRMIHAGHAWMLRWAKEQGDILVVGVNDDASAGRLRGTEFMLPLNERIELLASMDAVDWIVPFSQDEPREVCELLKPDIMVKGSDYAEGGKLPGSEFVKEVRFAPSGPHDKRSATGVISEIVVKRLGELHSVYE